MYGLSVICILTVVYVDCEHDHTNMIPIQFNTEIWSLEMEDGTAVPLLNQTEEDPFKGAI